MVPDIFIKSKLIEFIEKKIGEDGVSLLVALFACASICKKPLCMKQINSATNTTTKALITRKHSYMQPYLNG
jgi:hypothetical protein